MAALMDVYDAVLKGSGQVVGIVGEAGVGKSRLLLEFVNLLAQDEFIYLEGRCLHYGGSMSYLPVLDIIRSYFDIKNNDSNSAIKEKISAQIDALHSNLRSSQAPLEELLGLTCDDETFSSLDPQQKREQTFEAIRDLLLRISRNKPLIIAVEDLHWIDGTSEEFPGLSDRWLANSQIMLLLLYRQEYSHHWVNKSEYTQISLSQLQHPFQYSTDRGDPDRR